MLTDNDTPFAALGFEQWHPNGATMAVVVARAGVRVEPDGQQFLEERELVLADVFEGDPHKTPMLQVNDLIPFKPAADITVRGSLRAREPGLRIEGGLRVDDGPWTRLRGCGPRQWFFDGQWRLSAAEPVLTVPLDWRLAAGGRIVGDPDAAVDPRNPIGPGMIDAHWTSERVTLPAPQIDSADHPVTGNPFDRPAPQGLGPVPPWWLQRQQHAGTYDDAWQANVHPRLPRDFDYRHYQTAPPALVQPGYLIPGAVIHTLGLRPGGEALSVALPDLVLVARFDFSDGRSVAARLNLDGLHLDLSGEVARFDLTWRTWIESCPSLLGISLTEDRWDRAMNRNLPIAGPEGLIEAHSS